MTSNKNTNMLKILVVGDSNTGKTSIVRRFVYNKFDSNLWSNLSCEYDMKIIKV
jgi:GTPase SAR1 family protein